MRRGLLVVMLTLISFSSAAAQFRPLADGRIIGQVVDSVKVGVPKAVITISSNEPTKQTRSVKSDKRGKFEASLPDGNYLLKIEKCGFVGYTSPTTTKIVAGVEWRAVVPMVADPGAVCGDGGDKHANSGAFRCEASRLSFRSDCIGDVAAVVCSNGWRFPKDAIKYGCPFPDQMLAPEHRYAHAPSPQKSADGGAIKMPETYSTQVAALQEQSKKLDKDYEQVITLFKEYVAKRDAIQSQAVVLITRAALAAHLTIEQLDNSLLTVDAKGQYSWVSKPNIEAAPSKGAQP